MYDQVAYNSNKKIRGRGTGEYERSSHEDPVILYWPYEELVRRYKADWKRHPKNAHGWQSPDYHELNKKTRSDLIVEYLNADDVMQLLECNRRTAIDYLNALKSIHKRSELTTDLW
jgi:hypothetical protein